MATGDRAEYFPKIEAKHGYPIDHWFDQLGLLESNNYRDQVGFLIREHGFSQAHANAVVMFYRGSTTSKRHDSPDEYFQTLSPEQRRLANEIFASIRETHPELELVMAWNQPMLRHGRDYVFGLSASTKHLSMNPFSPAVIDQLRERLTGCEATSHIIRVPLDWEVDTSLLRDMVALRLQELQA